MPSISQGDFVHVTNYEDYSTVSEGIALHDQSGNQSVNLYLPTGEIKPFSVEDYHFKTGENMLPDLLDTFVQEVSSTLGDEVLKKIGKETLKTILKQVMEEISEGIDIAVAVSKAISAELSQLAVTHQNEIETILTQLPDWIASLIV